MTIKTPKISIGLPVFNGDRFIEETLNSILTQTFSDFELIICDNASTDRTGEICRDYQSRDSRISYHRNEANIGGGNNANLTFYKSKGMYFCWAAHDDVYAPNFFERCAEVLDNNLDVVLCHTVVKKIDENGNFLGIVNREKGAFLTPHERFRSLAGLDHDCEDICGLIRSDILQRTSLNLNYTDSDRTLLVELSLFGRFYQVAEPLFYKRLHPNMSTIEFPDWHGRMAWFFPDIKQKPTFPHWLQLLHYIRIIVGSPISISEKLECSKYMFRWVFFEYHGRRMVKEVVVAAQYLLEMLIGKITCKE